MRLRLFLFSFVFVLFYSLGYSVIFKTNGNFVIIQGFESKYLNTKKIIRVYLPKSYFVSTNYYPVFYAHDGQNLYYDPNNKMKWNIDLVIDDLVSRGKIREFVVVGIDHAGVDRVKEYTPFPISYIPYNVPLEYSRAGGGELYGRFLVEELKPFIESNFRVYTNKQNVGTFGSSLGGLISLYLGMWYPDIFGVIGCFSPSFWWGLERNKTNVLQNLSKLKTLRIYIDMGYQEKGEAESNVIYTTREINDIFSSEMSFPDLLYLEDKKGLHNEMSWNERVGNFFVFSFPSKSLSKKVVSLSVDYYPSEWGVGDRGFWFANIVSEDGITRTDYSLPLSLSGFKLVGKGVLEASSEGKGKIQVSLGNLSDYKEIVIDPISRKYGVSDIKVFVSASSVEFLVENEEGKSTNYTISFLPNEEKTEFFTSLTNLRTKNIKGRFVIDGQVKEEVKQILFNKKKKEYKFKF